MGRFGEGRDAPEIDRLQLRQLLLGSIPAHKIQWGHGVRSIERKVDKGPGGRDNGCVIHFANGSLATGFKLIVGADGGWSKVRPLVSQSNPKSSCDSELKSSSLGIIRTTSVFGKNVHRRKDLSWQSELQDSQ
jgi:hypothetical protein